MAATLPRATRRVRKPFNRPKGSVSEYSHIDLKGGVAENINLVAASISAGDSEVNAVRKVAYLNAFVRLLQRNRESFAEHRLFTRLLYSLRACLLNEQRSVRAATLRTLRYLVNDGEMVQRLVDIKLDLLIMRSFDSVDARPIERVQAMRFIRKLAIVCPQHIPHSLVVALVATAEHLNSEEKLMNAALATLSEIAVVNPSIVAFSRGIKAILRGAVNCVSDRMGESLLMSVLYLLNHPDTRCLIRPHNELEVIIAPFTDLHYRHSAEGHKDEPKEDRELQIKAAQMSAVTMFRSWAGLICFCNPNGWGLKSLVGVLRLPNSTTRRGVMNLLYNIFKLNPPEWTDDFEQALTSTDPCRPRDSWRLEEQWVVEEAKVVLSHSHLRKERTNLVTCYIAVLLTTFIQAGLFESLVEVVRSGNDSIVVQATILLGELLHLSNTILPLECSSQTHCLPSLISVATSFDTTATERNRATAVVNCLDRLHQRKKISARPDSLYLQLTLSKSESTKLKESTMGREPQITNSVVKELEDANIDGMLRESQVLTTKDCKQWNWNVIGSLLKSSHVTMRRLEEVSATKFVKRLCYFYKPSSGLFCKVEQTYANVQKFSAVGSRLMQFLLGGEEGIKLAQELVTEITACIRKVADGSVSRDDILSAGSVSHTLSRDYFLFLGKLTTSSIGMGMLRKLGIFSCLLSVCDVIQRRDLNKLLLTSLDYSHSRLCRVILSKILTGIDSNMRLYATSYLRVLLRAQLPEFKDWGIEMLITQLYDTDDTVINEAVDILDEACDDESYLHTVVLRFPALLHIRDRGVALFTRFLSVNRGFWYLQSLNYITEEMDRWYQDYNRRYVVQTEQCLAECLTGYRKTDEGVYIRRSQIQLARLDVFVPVHFYGQLVQLKEGCQLLQRQKHLDMFVETLKYPSMTTSDVLDKKAVIWALGHIGTSHWGEQLLEGKGVISQLVQVAETSPVLSIRGTAFYSLCLIARTKQGADKLNQLNWLCLRHKGEELWPVTEASQQTTTDVDIFSPERPVSSDGSTVFTPVFSEPDNAISSYQPMSPDKPDYNFTRHRHSLVIPRSTANDFQTLLPLQKSESMGTILDSGVSSFRKKESSSYEHLNSNKPLSVVVAKKHNQSSCSDENSDREKSCTLDSPRALRHILEGSDKMNVAARLIGRRTPRPVSLLADAEAVRKLYVAESSVSKYQSSWSDDSWLRVASGISGEGSYVGITVPANLDTFYKVEHSEYKGSWANVFPLDINEKFMDLLEKKGAATKILTPAEEQETDEQGEKQQEQSVDPAVLRKELFRLLGNLATAVGSKATQQGLSLFKDRFPDIFNDSNIYLDVCEMLAVYHYSLPARRLAHSLFEGIKLDPAPPRVMPSKGRNRSFSTSEASEADLTVTSDQLRDHRHDASRRRSSCGDIDEFRNKLAAKDAVKPRPINVSHTGMQEQARANCEQGRRAYHYFASEDI